MAVNLSRILGCYQFWLAFRLKMLAGREIRGNYKIIGGAEKCALFRT
jgi:hypothetical protein